MIERGDNLNIVRRKRIPPSTNKLFPILILIATISMSIGYASINSIIMNISGEVVAKSQEGIFITEISYISDVNANLEESKILNAYQTKLDSVISLSSIDANSSITYKITIYNSTKDNYEFKDVEYLAGEDTYSNENIIFELNGLQIGDTLNKNKEITFTITFNYLNNRLSSDNLLKSLLNFKFSIVPYVVASYEYTGDFETFIVPRDGVYQIELWGAQGGGVYGGYGGYTSGNIELTKNNSIYIYVGEHQDRGDFDIVFNGGGAALAESSHETSINRYTTGGGATDIRLIKGQWNDFESLKSRIMVAGGGGGTNDASKIKGGAGGGIIGYDGVFSGTDTTYIMTIATGGSQTSGGIGGTSTYGSDTFDGDGTPGGFGYGGNSITLYKSGGGSGYYGGGSSSVSRNTAGSGGGGSSFISGHNGCNAISNDSIEGTILHTGQNIHYSGYKFVNTIMIDGAGYNWTTEKGEYSGMPSHDATSIMTGNKGNGYAKITFIGEIED